MPAPVGALPLPGPVRITPLNGPWPLHDAAASRAIETRALAAHAPHTLMQRAGGGVARLALALVPHARRVQVLAGPGNNGGDGLVAARLLHQAGIAVQVRLFADAARLPPDAAAALAAARAAGVPIAHGPGTQGGPGATPDPDLVIDALLGLGTRSAPSGEIAQAIAAARAWRARGARVLAVDLPSGLHPDTGHPPGEGVIADSTVALLTLKPGLFTAQGRDHAGEVWLDTLALPPAADAATAWLSGPPAPPQRAHASHKGRYGDVLVVGGAAGMVGAAMLAARAAAAAGAGRVHLGLLDPSAPGVDPAWPELMSRPAAWQAPAPWLNARTVVCGCGGGDGVRSALPPLLAHAGRLVLDADALNAIAADTALMAALRARAGRNLPTVLTPHPLEAARLLGVTVPQVQADRLQAAQRLATATGAVVVLKGSGTVVAAPGAVTRVNPSGNAALASAGTGDVLAGWLGGRWAGAEAPFAEAATVAADAVWAHGHAADRHLAAGHRGPLCASALITALARAD